MKPSLFFLFAVGLALPLAALAGEPASPITITNARVRAVPPISGETAAFMVIINDADQPVRLIGASASIADLTAPMITTREERDGKTVLGMKVVPFLEVPAHGKLELKPGGDHLMLMDLKSTPKEGETVRLTLRFQPAAPGEIVVEAAVTKD
jgi:copper(I)-binding protein